MHPQNPSYALSEWTAYTSQYLHHSFNLSNTCFGWHDGFTCPALPHRQQESMDLRNHMNSAQPSQTAETVADEQIEAYREDSLRFKSNPTLEMLAKDSIGGTQTSSPILDNEFPSIVGGSLGSSLLNSPLDVRPAEEASSSLLRVATEWYVWTETVQDFSLSTIGNDIVAAFILTRPELFDADANDPEVWPGHQEETSFFYDATWSDHFENKL